MRCRSCGAYPLSPVLSLGDMPLANALLTEQDAPEDTYPLHVVFCPSCSLVQITETVPPDILFRDYAYFSSVSSTILNRSRELSKKTVVERGLTSKGLVMEIASNDGYLLQYYKQAGIPVLGIEPAENIASEAEASGIPTECEFFSEELAQNYRRCADVVHAHNVLAHVADLNGFVRGIETILKGNGVAIIEVPYVKDMIERCEFDTIYHEHLCYFSVTSLYVLFERADLMIRNVEYFPVHGGTLRLYVEHDGKPSELVQKLLIEEDKAGITNYTFYQGFSGKVQMLVSKLKEFLAGIKAQGGTIVAYGAAAKGCVLLNYSQIGRETIEYAVDIAPYKQGKYMPGTRLEIHPPSKILGDMPNYLLLLPWNFKDEIMNQQAEYRARGGRIIVPVPQLEVI